MLERMRIEGHRTDLFIVLFKRKKQFGQSSRVAAALKIAFKEAKCF